METVQLMFGPYRTTVPPIPDAAVTVLVDGKPYASILPDAPIVESISQILTSIGVK